jgi:outer membrane protein TolC
MKKIIFGVFVFFVTGEIKSAEIDLDSFLRAATANDSQFEILLIKEMQSRYQKALTEPAKDLMISVKARHELNLPQSGQYQKNFGIQLSKIFPVGLKTDLGYALDIKSDQQNNLNSGWLQFSLPVARNAFGRADLILDKLAQNSQDIAVWQALDAYEDYTARTLILYYRWYLAWETLNSVKVSVADAQRLYLNLKQRKKENIANEIDVQKTRLQYLRTQTEFLQANQQYQELTALAQLAAGQKDLVPVKPPQHQAVRTGQTVDEIIRASRVGMILEYFLKKEGLSMRMAFENLLPSVWLNSGYKNEGKSFFYDQNSQDFWIGFSIEMGLPFTSREKAAYETALLKNNEQKLKSDYSLRQLKVERENLNEELDFYLNLLDFSKEKKSAALAIYKEESINYQQGRSSLNDYISAINSLNQSRLDFIKVESALNLKSIEWNRLGDFLVIPKK